MVRKGLLSSLDGSLSSSEACDRNSEWRARYIVETDMVAELNRCRITTVLTADTALEAFACTATFLDSVVYELTYRLLVESLEWVSIEDLVAEVVTHECSYVVT